MDIRYPEYIDRVIKRLGENGHEAFIVGGSVRDILLGKEPNDWDVCTDSLPEDTIRIFEDTYRVVPTGLKHGTITVVIEDDHVEITTYRIDDDYNDGRRPETVKFIKDIKGDLSRRDFTINAMAFNYETGLIDFYGGMNDLDKKLIRTVGDAKKRFNEDYLRLLRCIRFATQLNFDIEDNTFKEVESQSEKITSISSERIRVELNKMLLSSNPVRGIELLADSRLLKYILPELDNCIGFEQHNPHHTKDVFDHTMDVLSNTERNLNLRLAALLHDIGKPQCFTMDDNNIGHFYGHHRDSERLTKEILTRLRYDNNTIDTVATLVREHMIDYTRIGNKALKKLIARVGEDNLDNLFKLNIADKTNKGDYEQILIARDICYKILNEKQPLGVKDLAINGRDIMDFGIKPGKEIGEILNRLLDEVLENPNLNNRKELLHLVKNMICDKKKRT